MSPRADSGTDTGTDAAYVTFDGRIAPLEWGRATYTILPLTDDVMHALGKTRRVEGELNEFPVNLGIARADVVDTPFLWTGKALMAKAGVAPGQDIEVRLRPAPDDLVEMPSQLTAALAAAELTPAWEALTPGKRRGLLHPINSAKRPDTLQKRIAALLADLSGKCP